MTTKALALLAFLLLASSLSAAPKPQAKSAAPSPRTTSAAPTAPTTVERLEAQVADDAKHIAALQLVADVAELDRLIADLRAAFPHHSEADRAAVLKQFPRWSASVAVGAIR